METRFENVTVDTEQVLCSLYSYAQKKGIVRQSILMSVFLVLSLYLSYLLESLAFLALAAYYIYLLVKTLNYGRINGKKAYLKRLEYYDNTVPPMTHRFYNDYFVSSDVDSTNITPYCKIKKVEIKHSMILITRKNGEIYHMCDTGFTKGNVADFCQFIQMKTNMPIIQK